MTNIVSLSLIISLLMSPIFILIIYFLPEKHARVRAWMPVLASGSVFLSLLSILPYSLNDLIFESPSILFTPDITMIFRIDLFGLYFGLIASLIWLLASIYSMGYMIGEHSLRRFYCFFTACLYFTLGISFAGNLFTLFIFYELVTISGYPLIFHEETEQARKASLKYLYYALSGDAFVLFSVFMTYHVTGSLNLDKTGAYIYSSMNSFYILIILTILGFGVKAAIMPLHGWVADAHPAAPSPASALLSGVLVNVGILGMARIFYNSIGSTLLYMANFPKNLIPLALFTITAASIIAINQDNLKRRLAYSTIGQLSYIVLGLAMNNKKGLEGGLVHIANHAFMKATLFLCAGAIIKETGIKNISEMKGLSKRMPVTMVVFAIASFGMIGMPPLCGFVSKWVLGEGAIEAGEVIYIAILLISSLLASVYFLPIIYNAFFQKGEFQKTFDKWYEECSVYMLISMITGVLLVIIFGIFVLFPGSPLYIVTRIADKWIMNPSMY
ncbi:MAG: hypothetical protein HY934_11150 [Candidatus Firestonebacteria bacterium]|nr:hypothetical protein [Candidatus Firestonebacteria bacterium]